ncbi:MAG: hypothetical protein JWR16_265 [Nevskia sp.]|nr:hypothetical protein [Nevskia sp.]
MNIESNTKPSESTLGTSSTPVKLPRTNNQIKAAVIADGLAAKAKWKTLLAEAKTVWTKVPPEDLAKVDGNFYKLAGLVQLRYQVSREESDRQVKDFFDKHYSVA